MVKQSGRFVWLRGTGYISAVVLIVGLSTADGQRRGRDRATPNERANEVLQLHTSRLAHLELNMPPGKPFNTEVELDGQAVTLKLEPHSVRAAHYRVLVEQADGTLHEAPAGPVRTFRGHIPEIANSAVAASLDQNGLSARILLPGDKEFWIEPAFGKVPNTDAGAHVVYESGDVAAAEPCGTDPSVHFDPAGWGANRAAFGGACGTGMCVAEVACDADFEFFTDFNSNVADVEGRINEVFNAVNIQYERDVSIMHQITTIIVRTGPTDPYTSTSSSTLLTEFRNHWNAAQGAIQRDVAQLFTGRELDGSTIGIAWLDAVCGSYGYGVVESNFTSNFALVTDLSAHELGHNWGAGHCSCNGYTMNPSITGANAFNPANSMTDIMAFRDTRSCLEGLSGCTADADCDDGDPCTGIEQCTSGSCMPGSGPDCNDGDACTADSCDSATGGCVNVQSDCDDGDPCTTDSCDAATGCSSTAVDCDDGDLCTTDTCDGSGCGYQVVSCDDGDPCTNDACDSNTGCTHDTIVCSGGEVCLDGACVPCIVNGSCDGGEDCSSCPQDCPAGPGAACGNGICETAAGEDCLSCGADCNGKQNGNPNRRYCCGGGGGINPVGCSDSRCSTGEWACTADPADPFCCGDGTCSPGEDTCSCDVDCGPPPATEGDCGDGADGDCDGAVDCADDDCSGDPACACNGNGTCEAGEDCMNCASDCPSTGPHCGDGVCDSATGEDCVNCAADCNGRQNGRPANRYCCGAGGGSNPVGCGDALCTADGNSCSDVERTGTCCGDGQCDAGEDDASCGVDCP